MLFGLHAQHRDAGRAPLELRFGLEGGQAAGGRRQQRVRAEEVVEGHVAELVLLVREAHVAVVRCCGGGRARGVPVGRDARRRAARQHARGDHGAAGGRGARPQVVGDLRGHRDGTSHFICPE